MIHFIPRKHYPCNKGMWQFSTEHNFTCFMFQVGVVMLSTLLSFKCVSHGWCSICPVLLNCKMVKYRQKRCFVEGIPHQPWIQLLINYLYVFDRTLKCFPILILIILPYIYNLSQSGQFVVTLWYDVDIDSWHGQTAGQEWVRFSHH